MSKQNDFKERLSELISHFSGGTTTKFAQTLGVHEATIRHYLRDTLPRIDFLIILTEKLPVNGHWLLTGEGEMLTSNVVNTDTMQNDLDNVNETSEMPSSELQFVFKTYIEQIQEKDKQLIEQAKEIGRLESENKQLNEEKQHSRVGAENADRDVTGAVCADVG